MSSRDAELHCPSCSLGTVSRSRPGVCQERALASWLQPHALSPAEGRILAGAARLRDVSLEASEP